MDHKPQLESAIQSLNLLVWCGSCMPLSPLCFWTSCFCISGSTLQSAHACLCSKSFVCGSSFQLWQSELILGWGGHYLDHLGIWSKTLCLKLPFAPFSQIQCQSQEVVPCFKNGTEVIILSLQWRSWWKTEHVLSLTFLSSLGRWSQGGVAGIIFWLLFNMVFLSFLFAQIEC